MERHERDLGLRPLWPLRVTEHSVSITEVLERTYYLCPAGMATDQRIAGPDDKSQHISNFFERNWGESWRSFWTPGPDVDLEHQ